MTTIEQLLAAFWDLDGAVVEPLAGGINSETWSVWHAGSRYVAKQVPLPGLADLVAGCEIAASLAAAGFATGPPVPTSDGRVVLTEHRLALLEYVHGRELEGETVEDQRWMAATLAAIHRAGGPERDLPTADFMAEWVTPDRAGVAAHDWLLQVLAEVSSETAGLAVTWSVLHTDPAPEAFRHDDRTGITGVVDWTGARRGPVLYDVASVVMYLGGVEHSEPFLTQYTERGPLSGGELRHLDAFRRFREAIQGTYFAWRLAADDLTGGVDRTENVKGLEDARRRLAALGR